MRYASLCDGIGAAHVAARGLGWTCAWTSEIAEFPAAVVARRWGYPNLGDMTMLRAVLRGRRKHHLGTGLADLDLVCGGTPCQAFSVAGLRESLQDERGNLSLEFVRIVRFIDAYRRQYHGQALRYVFWENVPGVLSTQDNAFGCFLAALVGEDAPLCPPGGKWTDAGVAAGPEGVAAWRVLDAQYFGLAQRRRRVFLVFCPRGGADPAAVLFEPASLRRDPPPRGKAGQGAAAGHVSSLDASYGRLQGCSGQDANHGHSHLIHTGPGGECMRDALASRDAKGPCSNLAQGTLVAFNPQAGGKQTTLGASAESTGTLGTTQTPAVAFTLHGTPASAVASESEVAQSLLARDQGRPDNSSTTVAVAFQTRIARNGRGQPKEITDALTSCEGGTHADSKPYVAYAGGVRRLTPVECARLQGFPDDYLDIVFRGKPAADSQKYKALGNSWAVPVVRWIWKRIAAIEANRTTNSTLTQEQR